MSTAPTIESDSVFSEETFALKPLSALVTWERNYRKGDVDAIAASISRFGFNGALRVWKDNIVMAGNHALLALRQLKESGEPAPFHVAEADGDWYVKTIDLSHLNRMEAEAFAIADNHTQEVGGNDDEALARMLKEISEHDSALVTAAGYDDEALKELLATVSEPKPQEDEGKAAELVDRAAELQKEWATDVGQVWILGQHRLVIGDCTDRDVYNEVLQGKKPVLAFLDPPYGMNLDTEFSKRPLTEKAKAKHPKQKDYESVIGDDAPYDPTFMLGLLSGINEQFWWGADYYREFLPSGGSWIVWDKREGLEDVQYTTAEFELCWSSEPHGRKIIRARWFGLCGTESQDIKTRVHPTQKPLQVYDWIFDRYAVKGDCIVDPYSGSGSGIIASEKGGYKCAAVEISPAYAAVSIQRWSDLTGLEPKLAA